MKKSLLLCAIFCLSALLSADGIRLASLWTDHAIVQRDKPIVVWGWCDTPRTVVTATLGTSSASGATAWDGRFELRLPALPAGGPYELTVTAATGEECRLQDIWTGEVWLVSGQSNAQFPLKAFGVNDPLAQTPQYLAEGGEDPLLRCYTVPNDALCAPGYTTTPNVKWELSSAKTAPYFTAIGAWFALNFRKHFPEIPIGIIHSSWGGTPITAWCSRSILASTPEGRKLLEEEDLLASDPATWQYLPRQMPQPMEPSRLIDVSFEKLTQQDRGNQGFALGYAAPDFDDSAWKEMTIPGSWIKQKLSDFGAIWVRRTVEVPASWAGQPLEIHLGGVDKHDVTYFNGKEVGATGKGWDTQYWDVRRAYPVAAEQARPGQNTIAIRAFCFYYDGAFTGKPDQYYLLNKTTGETIPLADTTWKAQAEYSFTVKEIPKELKETVNYQAPHRLFDNKIRPLIPYGIRGVLWYQGESDCYNNAPDFYLARFSAMIREWRYLWAQGEDFPFYFVQLANFHSKPNYMANWFKLQNAQRLTYLQVPNTGCITASDLALNEPDDIHPHDKRTFGYRLFQLALANVYGAKEVIPQGPTMDSLTADGATLRVHFLFGEGLHTDAEGPVKGFDIAGEDGNYVPATAEIQADEVILSAEGIAKPVSCRYNAVTDMPEGHLLNAANLPALSFFDSLK
ncbi:MAG: hypothetical protein MJ202_00270 [Lentisphaeria bacterium]|nr:hypothetical protein [Lentisphaeria bacterium]